MLVEMCSVVPIITQSRRVCAVSPVMQIIQKTEQSPKESYKVFMHLDWLKPLWSLVMCECYGYSCVLPILLNVGGDLGPVTMY